MISEGEKWARIGIFILIGAYATVVFILAMRFIIRTCCFNGMNGVLDEHRRWEEFIRENRNRRLFHGSATPPPPFTVALKCPLPFHFASAAAGLTNQNQIDIDIESAASSTGAASDELPPAYEDVFKNAYASGRAGAGPGEGDGHGHGQSVLHI